MLSFADKKRLAAEQEQNLRMRNQPNLLLPVSSGESIKNNQFGADFATSPIDSVLEEVGCSSLIPFTSNSTCQTCVDLSDFLPPPSIPKKVCPFAYIVRISLIIRSSTCEDYVRFFHILKQYNFFSLYDEPQIF